MGGRNTAEPGLAEIEQCNPDRLFFEETQSMRRRTETGTKNQQKEPPRQAAKATTELINRR